MERKWLPKVVSGLAGGSVSNALKTEMSIFSRSIGLETAFLAVGRSRDMTWWKPSVHLPHPVNSEETPRDDWELTALLVTSHYHCGVT